jgi:hypothetical protein
MGLCFYQKTAPILNLNECWENCDVLQGLDFMLLGSALRSYSRIVII